MSRDASFHLYQSNCYPVKRFIEFQKIISRDELMSRIPTAHEREMRGETEEQPLMIGDNKGTPSVFMVKYSRWILFHAIIYFAALYVVYTFNPLLVSIQYAAIILILFSSVFIYGSFSSGTKMVLPGMAYVPGTGAIQDITNFRQRMFSNYMGPLIGILIGLVIFLITLMIG